MRAGYVYIMGSRRTERSTSAQPAISSNVFMSIAKGLIDGFTKEHGCKLLVWFEVYDDLQEARRRELQMKEWKRPWKIRRIEESNLEWDDLYPNLF